MKKFLTLAVVALIAMSASAQKGSMYIGASSINFSDQGDLGTGFIYAKSGDNKMTGFGITPEFGYFFEDNMAFGIMAGYGYTKTELNGGDSKTSTIRINPYLRYFLNQSGNFGFYIQGGVNYEYETEAKSNLIGVNFMPGVSYAISPKFTATATFGNLGYEYFKQDGLDAANGFGLNLKMSSLMFGLSYCF